MRQEVDVVLRLYMCKISNPISVGWSYLRSDCEMSLMQQAWAKTMQRAQATKDCMR